MPSSLVDNFIGGSYTPRSTTIADDALINLYPETTQVPGAAKRAALIGTPGLLKDTQFSKSTGADGCRGMFSQDILSAGVLEPFGNVVYVIGAGVYTGVGGPFGAGVVNDNGMVTFASAGIVSDQIAICSGGKLYVFTPSSFALSAAIVVPLTNDAVCVGFMDGYFLLLERATKTIWFSALNDATSWDALDFFTRSHTADDLVGFVVANSRIWTFGSANLELWYDVGDADNPFAPYPGSVVPIGAVNYSSITVADNSVVWLSHGPSGTMSIVRASVGSAPTRISTPAIDQILLTAQLAPGNPQFVEAFSYVQAGHSFAAFQFATVGGDNGQTWIVDLSEPSNPWHQRASTVNGLTSLWRVRGCCLNGFDTDPPSVLVGDRFNGNVYKLDLETFTENGTAITRTRRAPYLSAQNQWIFVDAIELGCETGVGNSDDPDPQITLQLSRDSGNTFGTAVSVSMGAAGAVNQRVRWNRLGRARADRLVIEVTSSAKVKHVWTPGLWLRATPGSGEM